MSQIHLMLYLLILLVSSAHGLLCIEYKVTGDLELLKRSIAAAALVSSPTVESIQVPTEKFPAYCFALLLASGARDSSSETRLLNAQVIVLLDGSTEVHIIDPGQTSFSWIQSASVVGATDPKKWYIITAVLGLVIAIQWIVWCRRQRPVMQEDLSKDSQPSAVLKPVQNEALDLSLPLSVVGPSFAISAGVIDQLEELNVITMGDLKRLAPRRADIFKELDMEPMMSRRLSHLMYAVSAM